MKLPSLLTLLALTFTLSAQDKPVAKPAAQGPDLAAPKFAKDGSPEPGFVKRHEGFVEIAKAGNVDLLFLGDSITAGWGGKKEIWDAAFGKYKPANFGIGGDRTQHVLWRIQNGELTGITPKAAVLMIGTNNSGSDSVEGIAKGITAIVKYLHEKSPKTKVLLLAIFPAARCPARRATSSSRSMKSSPSSTMARACSTSTSARSSSRPTAR